ncbi:MAG TPA: hypothetical protein HPP87_09615 [Planctomycetes bacterium]|nr:hypothetical protein [Planctomycetota bacterium]
MTNGVDFYQGACTDLAIPAGRCEVFIEGVPCPDLEVAEVVCQGRPGFGYAKLRYNPTTQAGNIEIAEKEIEICRFVNTGLGEVKIEPVWVFAGRIEEVDTVLRSDKWEFSATARDFSARLDSEIIDGKRIATGGGKSIFWLACAVVFNEDGQPNASIQQVQHNGRSYIGFTLEGGEAKHWTTAQILEYLLSEYTLYGQLQVPPTEYSGALTGRNVADELAVDGKSVLDALGDCCEQTGLEFVFRPTQTETGPGQCIEFYRPGKGRSVELNLQYAGEKLSISRTNVCELESERKNQPAGAGIIEVINVRTPILATHYEVGDRVTTSPDSRDVLGIRRDSRSIFWIDRVRLDFERQCTELRILRKRT